MTRGTSASRCESPLAPAGRTRRLRGRLSSSRLLSSSSCPAVRGPVRLARLHCCDLLHTAVHRLWVTLPVHWMKYTAMSTPLWESCFVAWRRAGRCSRPRGVRLVSSGGCQDEQDGCRWHGLYPVCAGFAGSCLHTASPAARDNPAVMPYVLQYCMAAGFGVAEPSSRNGQDQLAPGGHTLPVQTARARPPSG